jgi:hypothetical protein
MFASQSATGDFLDGVLAVFHISDAGLRDPSDNATQRT